MKKCIRFWDFRVEGAVLQKVLEEKYTFLGQGGKSQDELHTVSRLYFQNTLFTPSGKYFIFIFLDLKSDILPKFDLFLIRQNSSVMEYAIFRILSTLIKLEIIGTFDLLILEICLNVVACARRLLL